MQIQSQNDTWQYSNKWRGAFRDRTSDTPHRKGKEESKRRVKPQTHLSNSGVQNFNTKIKPFN